jgi:S-adenosylmethionine uptake transporter
MLPARAVAQQVAEGPSKLALRPQIWGILLYAAGVFAIAVTDAFAKGLTRAYPIVEIVLLRSLFGYIPIILQYRVGSLKGRDAVLSRAPLIQLLRGGLLLASCATFFLSLSLLPLADATAISLIAPLLMAILGVFLLNEVAGKELYLSLAVAIAGSLLIVRPYAAELSLSILVAFASAIFYALAAFLTRIAGRWDNPLVSAVWGNTIMSVAAAAAMPLVGWQWPSDADWWLFLGLGASGGIASLLYAAGLRSAALSEVAILDYSVFVWAALFGSVIFDEAISRVGLAGATLIIGSGIYQALRKSRRPGDGFGAPPIGIRWTKRSIATGS